MKLHLDTTIIIGMLMHLMTSSYAYYLPGVKMMTFKKDMAVPLYVNSLSSSETLLPIDYYDVPFCEPDVKEYQAENLGEYLTANRIENSPYKIHYLENIECAILCQKKYGKKAVGEFNDMIRKSYRVNWILDNLPVATATLENIHELGFPLGRYYESQKTSTLHNHIKIQIGYHIPDLNEPEKGRIVDFIALPYSLNYEDKDIKEGDKTRMKACDMTAVPREVILDVSTDETPVHWTYSIEWVNMPDRKWRTRWDVYFEAGSGSNEVHWFSIINALLIVLFLSGMVGMILMRSLHRDINRYNRVPTEEERAEEREESGWKLVHADVFRSPAKWPMLFCVMVGSGVQILYMTFITLLCASVGFLSPSNRGNLMVVLLVMYVLMGIAAGYASSRTYKMFKGKRWQLCTTMTALLFPGLTFAEFFLLNLFAWGAGSDAAVPFGSMVALVLLWFCISVPLVFVGAWFGYRQSAISFPVATSNIPRPIPELPWYMSTSVTAMVGGILPFGAIFVELYFILTSMWMNRYYYVFGFLLLAFLILISTCAEITLVLCYFQLCGEDYNWWWRSFIVSGSCGFYVFLYSTYYYMTRLQVHSTIGTLLYFGYMGLISTGLFLMTGMIGYSSSLWFTRKIYGSIKVD